MSKLRSTDSHALIISNKWVYLVSSIADNGCIRNKMGFRPRIASRPLFRAVFASICINVLSSAAFRFLRKLFFADERPALYFRQFFGDCEKIFLRSSYHLIFISPTISHSRTEWPWDLDLHFNVIRQISNQLLFEENFEGDCLFIMF